MNEKQVKWLLTLATISTIALVAIGISNVVTAILWYRDSQPEPKSFQEQCSDLAESGQYDKLQSIATDRLKDFPKDPMAFWYLAMSHYGKNDFDKAKETLRGIQGETPWWDSQINRMLVMISNREEVVSTSVSPREEENSAPTRQ